MEGEATARWTRRAELLDAMHKLADREIKAGRILDNGGLRLRHWR
jgi:hypothetical protein